MHPGERIRALRLEKKLTQSQLAGDVITRNMLSQIENGQARMVNTPWSSEPMPFAEAAEMGTRKVICDHSTIGMLVTCDGSIGEIPRESYAPVEERVVNELKAQGKPFAII